MTKEVKVYTTRTCRFCDIAKDFLTEHGVEFEAKDVQKDPEARDEFRKMGHMGVPIIVVDGEEIVGFDEAKLRKVLDIED